MVKKKLLKLLAKMVPSSGLRKRLLQMCNYKIGKDVYIGEDILILDDLAEHTANLIIEDRAAISPRVTFVLYSAPNESKIRSHINEKKGKIIVRQDAWIGTGAVIMPDIEIGEGGVVGANAVVTKNVLPYTVVAGVPAKQIKTVDVPWRNQ
jgi:acetyltransferase-like isoleucine patch superfamily enzyme